MRLPKTWERKDTPKYIGEGQLSSSLGSGPGLGAGPGSGPGPVPFPGDFGISKCIFHIDWQSDTIKNEYWML